MLIFSEATYQQALNEFQRLLDHEPANDSAIIALRDDIAIHERGQGYELPPTSTPVVSEASVLIEKDLRFQTVFGKVDWEKAKRDGLIS